MFYTSNRTNKHMPIEPKSRRPEHIVLVGASIGRAWRLESWAQRVSARTYTAEAVAAWQFDKSDALDEVFMRPKRPFHLTRSYLRSLLAKPPQPADVLILKECSSYFPGPLDRYGSLIDAWVKQARYRGIVPLVATVVPVTRTRSSQDPGKQDSLLEFNRWLRTYASQQGIHLLDLEAALSDGTPQAFLRNEYTSGDGSHLNSAAYHILDGVLQAALNELDAPVSHLDAH